MRPAETGTAARLSAPGLWRHPLLRDAVAVALALASLAWFLRRGIAALDIGEFGDETEKIVGARMIAAGGRLYDTVFSNHGPLGFALNHLWLLLTGTKDLASHRILQLGLFVLCAGAVAASPALATWRARSCAAALFLIPLSVVYAGAALHMTLYQSVAGALLAIALVLLPLPALLGRTPPRWAALAAGFAAAGAAFAGYPFAVSGALMAAAATIATPAGARLRIAVRFIAGGVAAAVLLAAWMAMHADFAGYAVYHVWFNQTVFAANVRWSPLAPLGSLVPTAFDASRLLHLLALAALYAAFALLVLRRWRIEPRRRAWAAALAVLFLGFAFLNPRGQNGIHGSTFLAGALAALAVAAGGLAVSAAPRALRGAALALLLGGAGLLVVVHARAVSTPHHAPLRDLDRIRIAVKPSDGREFRLMRAVMRPDERFLAVVFAPAIHVYADRLPVSKLFYYLPVQAKYAARPVAGYGFDLCRDFAQARPKVVFYLDRLGNGRYGFADYAPCVHAAIVADYVPLPWAPEYHFRRDIVAARPEILRDAE
jgi:hypothetical protein